MFLPAFGSGGMRNVEPDFLFQRNHFGLAQRPQLAERQRAQRYRADFDSNQFFDKKTQRLEHAPHFTFAPFMHFDLMPSSKRTPFRKWAKSSGVGHALNFAW